MQETTDRIKQLGDEHHHYRVNAMGVYKITLEDVNTGEKIVKEYYNLIPTSGFALITDAMTSPSPSGTILITHAAVGTGTTPPTLGDTTLQTESYRNAIASRTHSGNVAFATGFFNQTETNGHYREVGIFANGGATLVSRVIVDITKTTSQTLTVDWSITFVNAS